MNEASHQIVAEHSPSKTGCSLKETFINTYKGLHSDNPFFDMGDKCLGNSVEQKT
jgi:hypothetical protein